MQDDALRRTGLSGREFIALAALLISLTALSLDIMLPVLPDIAAALDVRSANDRQWVIGSFIGGLLIGQLGFGYLADRYGRILPLVIALALFVVASLLAAAATDFATLLVARTVQGIVAAAPRIIVVAIVRDLFVGRYMARTMSTIMTVFIMVPIFAPALGQLLAQTAGWRAPFVFLGLAGAIACVWTWARLPETRPAGEDARERRLGLAGAFAKVVQTPRAIGYILASGFMFAVLFSYIISAQQIFVDVYNLGDWFPLAFGSIAATMALANFTNSRVVVALGMRRVSHLALACFCLLGLAMLVAALCMTVPMALLWSWLAAEFFLFSLIVANFNALAMEPLGDVAGTAASVMGFVTTLIAGIAGAVVGQMFDGTALALIVAFFIGPVLALVTVLAIEGRAGFAVDRDLS